MKVAEQGVIDIVSSEYCRCGVRLRDGDRVLWCARYDCPETSQRGPTEWQSRHFKLNEPFEPFYDNKDKKQKRGR